MPSIHPQHSATSSASALVTVGRPDPFLWIFSHSSVARAWFAAIHFSNAAGVRKLLTIFGSGITVAMNGNEHRLLPLADLAKVLSKGGAADGTHIVLYGDSPMQTGWLYMTLAATGHAGDVSMLDGGINLWRAEERPLSTDATPAAT